MRAMRETEVKIEVQDAGELRRRLGLAGTVAVAPRLFEDNRVYDDDDATYQRSHRLVRLRSAGGRHTLTYKRPTTREEAPDGRYKVRIEHETEVSQPDEAHAVLEGLGLSVTYRYQKYRQTYRRGDVVVDLDETPIGVFVELEGTPEDIDVLARDLGFGPEHYIVKTYHDLFLERRSEGQDHMVFADGEG